MGNLITDNGNMIFKQQTKHIHTDIQQSLIYKNKGQKKKMKEIMMKMKTCTEKPAEMSSVHVILEWK